MSSALVAFLTSFIDHVGYLGVFLLMTLESACIPVPSFVIMPFAGADIYLNPARGFNIWELTLAGAGGNLFGSVLAYGVGAWGGRPFVHKYGKYILLRKKDVEKGEEFFRTRGDVTAFVSRLLPVVRTFISLPAGIAGMNFPRFCVLSFLGALPYCYLLTYLGVRFGQNWPVIDAKMHKADTAIILVLAVLFLFWLWHHLRPEPEEKTAPESA